MENSHDPPETVSPEGQHGRHDSHGLRNYDPPDSYQHADDTQSPLDRPTAASELALPLGHGRKSERHISRSRRASTASRPDYDVPDTYASLGEVADPAPVQNPYEETIHRHRSLEQTRSQEQEFSREQARQRRKSLSKDRKSELEESRSSRGKVSRLLTQFYTVSYLILFSIFGTLARLGLQALTNYPGTPVIFASAWPNFAGSLVMGFLAEDRMLFRETQPSSPVSDEEETASAAKRAHAAHKKTIPLYIGLATGFCGSLTSFSAFVRDTFLALSNDLSPSQPRNGGHTFLALLAVPLATLALSLAGLFAGAHLAIALAPAIASLSRLGLSRALLDRIAVVLAWGCWLGAVLLSALPPAGHADWRGKVTFVLVFAPLGCLARFFLSLQLNGRIPSFPLGTFTVNMAGTAVLAMSWALAHSNVAASVVVGCQVLTGVQDGFCGCLTTVSTWVAELAALRRRHAYMYGGASVLGGLAVAVAVMGGLRWSGGYEGGACKV
ncbi:CrcB-like protein-domain-containing protein [Chaetomium sp. MPI-SDFR-AT-0129]|nr:CrcB-like protein-domain-containing protein [Chaetomium sp. MPI-SDFR-AT-0129]